MSYLLLTILFFVKPFLISSDPKESVVLSNEIRSPKAFENLSNVVYYGFDFSLHQWVEVNGHSEVWHGAANKQLFLAEWADAYHERVPTVYYINKWFKLNGKFSYDYVTVQNPSMLGQEKWVVEQHTEVSTQLIQQSINKYELNKKTGVGFVIHPVLYDANENHSTCYFTFFDLTNKEILWTAKIRSKSEKVGRGHHKSETYDLIIPAVLSTGSRAFEELVYRPHFAKK